MVDTSEILDLNQYYGGFLYAPSTTSRMAKYCDMTDTADAADCQGTKTQSYGTTYEVVVYDANNNLNPMCFAHYVGAESYVFWTKLFAAAERISGFVVEQRVVVVNIIRGCESVMVEVMDNATLFAEFIHVTKNMLPEMGVEKTRAASLQKQAVFAPLRVIIEEIKRKYGL